MEKITENDVEFWDIKELEVNAPASDAKNI